MIESRRETIGNSVEFSHYDQVIVTPNSRVFMLAFSTRVQNYQYLYEFIDQEIVRKQPAPGPLCAGYCWSATTSGNKIIKTGGRAKIPDSTKFYNEDVIYSYDVD